MSCAIDIMIKLQKSYHVLKNTIILNIQEISKYHQTFVALYPHFSHNYIYSTLTVSLIIVLVIYILI